MIRKYLMVLAVCASGLTASAQSQGPQIDKNNHYLVYTKNVVIQETKNADEHHDAADAEEEEEKATTFVGRYFPHVSLCDWKEGMRFMVIPAKKDMVIKTFTEKATGIMVSSMSLRHKIMVYKGHGNDGGLHDKLYFTCENDGKEYYYEIPSGSFDDYCYTKFGVPTLAYLGDVDTAIDLLMGKTLITKNRQYNVDVASTSYGYDKVPVEEGIEVKVVAIGVGSRSYPVKIIVEDKDGNEFFQNVAFSRTNSGLRDDEFEDFEEKKHTFEGAFELLGDNVSVKEEHKKYLNAIVTTLYKTTMLDKEGRQEIIPRLTEMRIKSIRESSHSDYAKVVLEKEGKEYTKDLTFVQHEVVTDGINGQGREDFFDNLFAIGSLTKQKGVREANLRNIRNGVVKQGFTEAEVRLALGIPDRKGRSNANVYTWVYSSVTNERNCIVFFSKKTKHVTSVNDL